MGGACGTYGTRTGTCRVWVRKHDGGRPLGKRRRRWKANIEMIFKKWNEGVEWIDLAQDKHWWRAIINRVAKIRVS